MMRAFWIIGLFLMGFGLVSLQFGDGVAGHERAALVNPLAAQVSLAPLGLWSPATGGIALSLGVGMVTIGVMNKREDS